MEEEKKIMEETASEQASEQVVQEAAPQEASDKKDGGKKNKEKSGEKSKKKRVLNAIFLAVQILLVVLAITICLVMILNPKEPDQVSPLGLKLLPVRSSSMDGDKKDSFPKYSLVFATNPKNGGKDLKVGNIVTFVDQDANGQKFLNTHRIVAVEEHLQEDGTYLKSYQTQGDNNPLPDSIWKTPDQILAVYSFHIKGLGGAILWIREGYHFIFVIIIPLGLLFLYNIYLVAQIVLESKMRKAKALAAEKAKEAALASIDEEEIKRKAIEEYLRAQGLAAEQSEPQNKGDTE
ncbi:MAG TPA: hypothetical protein DIC18_02620 [Clostridiales bacterium]|nr:hypothetical protein [Clostridiales bacterium]HCU56212.1 hypothetical protein [Clostridiales bacterium]